MGVQERKERDKQKIRDLILHTAADLFLEMGFDKTSIRNIADAIEYSPGTIYLYFKDKNELFYAISEEGFRLFYQYFQEVLNVKDPMAQLKALGRAYVRFALENPAYYDLMFMMVAPMQVEQTQHGWLHGENSHRILVDIVAACQEQGYFKGQDLQTTAFWIWATVHGIVSLKISCRMKMYPEQDHEQLIQDALELFNVVLQGQK